MHLLVHTSATEKKTQILQNSYREIQKSESWYIQGYQRTHLNCPVASKSLKFRYSIKSYLALTHLQDTDYSLLKDDKLYHTKIISEQENLKKTLLTSTETKLFRYSILPTSLPYQTKPKTSAALNSTVLSLWFTHKHQKRSGDSYAGFQLNLFFMTVKFIYTSLTCKQLQEFFTQCHVCQ